MSSQPQRFVIIGGGYLGVWVYRFLMRRAGKLVRNGQIQVTVITPKNYHSFHGFTAEALTGVMSIANRQSPLRLIMRHATLVRAHAEHVDTERKVVRVKMVGDETIREIPYDQVVLGNGTYDLMDTIPGMRQHGFSVKEPGGVLSTRNQLIRMLETAEGLNDAAAAQAMLTVVVAGGGFAGVELAANIAEMFHIVKSNFPALQQYKARVILVHSGTALVPQLRPRYDRLADYITRELEKWGVEVILNTRLTRVQSGGVELSDGSYIPARTVISTVGQRSMVMPGTEAFTRTADGLIQTDDCLRVPGVEGVWTGGDTASVPHISGVPCPANALWAIMHGKQIGINLAQTAKNKPLKKLTYRGLGQAASMGMMKGASELYGMQFTGFIGWWLRFGFFILFMPSRRQAVRVLGDFFWLNFLGRYQTSMESVDPGALASKRAKESTATMEIAAIKPAQAG